MISRKKGLGGKEGLSQSLCGDYRALLVGSAGGGGHGVGEASETHPRARESSQRKRKLNSPFQAFLHPSLPCS